MKRLSNPVNRLVCFSFFFVLYQLKKKKKKKHVFAIYLEMKAS